jgi:type IV secretion system protein VirB9
MKKSLLLFLMLPVLAFGEITPPRGKMDARVRTIAYDSQDVVRIPAFYGVSTHIRFADSEIVEAVAIGDEKAWHVVPRANHLFVKPRETHANTNVTVLTDKRAYQFVLTVQKPDRSGLANHNLVFSLSFTYPEEEKAAQAKAAKQAELAKRLDGMDAPAVRNTDYWVKGSDSVIPEAAFDDGRFIHLVFAAGTDMPAVYEVDENGDESLINTHVKGNTLVVHRRLKSLMLRRGKAVALVENRAFDRQETIGNQTGTISTDVVRAIREDRP